MKKWPIEPRSVRGVFDGTLQSAAEYDPFGEPIVAPAGTAYGFTGELTDGNGLLYLRARYLAPALGTFASRDPWRGSASAPRTWNGYAWVEGNVVNRVDPGGMQSCFSSGGASVSQQTSAPLTSTPYAPTTTSTPVYTPTPTGQVDPGENPTLTLTVTPTAKTTPTFYETPSQSSGASYPTEIPWDELHAYADLLLRCLPNESGEYNEGCSQSLGNNVPTSALDAVGKLIEHIGKLYPQFGASTAVSLASGVLIGQRGPFTVAAAAADRELHRQGVRDFQPHPLTVPSSGFHTSLAEPSQIFHYISYLKTFQSGDALGTLGDFMHECLGFGTTAGILKDAQLTTLAYQHAQILKNDPISPSEFVSIMELDLSQAFVGPLGYWYERNPFCWKLTMKNASFDFELP